EEEYQAALRAGVKGEVVCDRKCGRDGRQGNQTGDRQRTQHDRPVERIEHYRGEIVRGEATAQERIVVDAEGEENEQRQREQDQEKRHDSARRLHGGTKDERRRWRRGGNRNVRHGTGSAGETWRQFFRFVKSVKRDS